MHLMLRCACLSKDVPQVTDEAKEEQEEGELIEVLPEPTDEELLAQLGLELEQQMADLTARDELPAGIMQQWAEEELRRDRVQWQPRRELPDQAMDEEEDRGDDAGEGLEFRNIKGSMLGPCELMLSSLPSIPFLNLFLPRGFSPDHHVYAKNSSSQGMMYLNSVHPKRPVQILDWLYGALLH